ncbi:MAG: hypothetical protein JST82_09635 [Bacteroidetes bacterium]|nr:hypothetical protein [Bacteroidota bacterium]
MKRVAKAALFYICIVMVLQFFFAIILLVLILFGAKLSWVVISTQIEDRRNLKLFRHFLETNKSIGCLKLSKEEQFYILDTENTKSIEKLLDVKYVPLYVLNEYIAVTPNEYLQHLYRENLKIKMKFNPDELIDGFYIKETKKGYDYIFVERMAAMRIKSFKTYDRLLRYIVFRKLRFYVPVRNGFIKTKIWSIKN